MNRRTFLASLVAIPAGIVAAVKIGARESVGGYPFQHHNTGIHGLLQKCGNVVDAKPMDLDEIFNKIYALKCNRKDFDSMVYLHTGENLEDREELVAIKRAIKRHYEARTW